jgi:hypothetical protein
VAETKITLNHWHPGTDPPTSGCIVLNHQFEYIHYSPDAEPPWNWIYYDYGLEKMRPCDPPRWWCEEPVPPDEDALTVKDLKSALHWSMDTFSYLTRGTDATEWPEITRLRRALGATEPQP